MFLYYVPLVVFPLLSFFEETMPWNQGTTSSYSCKERNQHYAHEMIHDNALKWIHVDQEIWDLRKQALQLCCQTFLHFHFRLQNLFRDILNRSSTYSLETLVSSDAGHILDNIMGYERCME